MIAVGLGGRGARYYGNESQILIGIRSIDERKKYSGQYTEKIDTPFGVLFITGAMIIKCGICGKQSWPISKGEKACRCDFKTGV